MNNTNQFSKYEQTYLNAVQTFFNCYTKDKIPEAIIFDFMSKALMFFEKRKKPKGKKIVHLYRYLCQLIKSYNLGNIFAIMQIEKSISILMTDCITNGRRDDQFILDYMSLNYKLSIKLKQVNKHHRSNKLVQESKEILLDFLKSKISSKSTIKALVLLTLFEYNPN